MGSQLEVERTEKREEFFPENGVEGIDLIGCHASFCPARYMTIFFEVPHVRYFSFFGFPCLSGVVFCPILSTVCIFPKRQDEARKKGRWSAGFSTIIHFPSLQGLSNLLLS